MKRGTLREQLNSSYIEAANRLMGKNARRRIVAYVESFDDVFFWSNLLRPLETEKVYFEVMLPSRRSLQKGKRSAIANHLGHQLGEYMIACVDADYDYLLQGATELSMQVCSSPYVFHTYACAVPAKRVRDGHAQRSSAFSLRGVHAAVQRDHLATARVECVVLSLRKAQALFP